MPSSSASNEQTPPTRLDKNTRQTSSFEREKLIVTEFVSPDRVAQASGGPYEDRNGDFTQG
jgi:hypothetical protein